MTILLMEVLMAVLGIAHVLFATSFERARPAVACPKHACDVLTDRFLITESFAREGEGHASCVVPV